MRGGRSLPGPYRTFTICDPKRRVIAAPDPRDRLVHHALVRVLSPIWERRFVHHNYACRPGRGIHRAALACRDYARRFPWYLKFDVARFYPSVSHEVLKGMLRRDVRGSRVMDVLERVIDSYDSGVPGRGLPIGALTSQWFALRVLHPLDRRLAEGLRVPTVRYADDAVCFGRSKAELRYVRAEAERFLDGLGLRMHPGKRDIHGVTEGIPFVGFRIFPTHLRVSGRSKVRARRKMRRWVARDARGEVSADSRRSSIASWVGHWGWANSYFLRKATIGKLVFRRA